MKNHSNKQFRGIIWITGKVLLELNALTHSRADKVSQRNLVFLEAELRGTNPGEIREAKF